MWEPQSLQINVVGAEAKSIFGTARYSGFWIGITNDGDFTYQTNNKPAVWEMPYWAENDRTGRIGTTKCLFYYLYVSKWSTDGLCTGDSNCFTACEVDRENFSII